MTDLAFARPVPGRGLISVAGADRSSFLQGLVSNDVRQVASDRGIWSALLTPQGKYLHDFIILADGDRLLLEADGDRIGELGHRLRRFKLRAAVDIEDVSPTSEVLYGWGEQAGARFGLETAGQVRRVGGAIVLLDPRDRTLGVRVVAPSGAAEALLRQHGFAPGDWADWDRRRILLGIPDGVRDLVVEKSILLENGFDRLNGVAWDKGCYMGQELTARTKYRGLIKKRLMPVRLTAAAAPGSTVTRGDGSEAGEIRSSSGDLALALIRLDALDTKLSVGAEPVEILAPMTASC